MRTARGGWTRAFVGVVVLLVCVPGAWAHGGSSREESPLVIGHRGAAGYLPDHTLKGYALAIKLGADYIEPDLVATQDGHLIARHEPNITSTTNVRDHPEFADRETTKVVDGVSETGWFASDFTLAEIKALRAVQPLPAERPTRFDGKFEIPTLKEVIDLAKRKSRQFDRRIGVYPETKHPTFHKDLGLALERRLVRVLSRAGWSSRRSPVFIQSFEQSNLQLLNRLTRVRLVQLVDANDVDPDGIITYAPPFDRPYDWTVSGDPELLARTFGFFTTDEGLEQISTYADGIGPWKPYIHSSKAIAKNPDGSVADANGDGLVDERDRVLLPAPSGLVERAHAHGLLIHTWTFRNEQRRLTSDFRGNPINEYLHFYELGVDGLFSDFPDTAFTARELFRLSQDEDYE
jgi:glycerophosphoryl diester phosphodiesterase